MRTIVLRWVCGTQKQRISRGEGWEGGDEEWLGSKLPQDDQIVDVMLLSRY